jgi:hypothetical protein
VVSAFCSEFFHVADNKAHRCYKRKQTANMQTQHSFGQETCAIRQGSFRDSPSQTEARTSVAPLSLVSGKDSARNLCKKLASYPDPGRPGWKTPAVLAVLKKQEKSSVRSAPRKVTAAPEGTAGDERSCHVAGLLGRCDLPVQTLIWSKVSCTFVGCRPCRATAQVPRVLRPWPDPP